MNVRFGSEPTFRESGSRPAGLLRELPVWSEADTETQGTAELFRNCFGSSLFGGNLILRNLLEDLARPERFELPTPWFVVASGKFKL